MLRKGAAGFGGQPFLVEYRLSLLGAFEHIRVQSRPLSVQ